jgi:cell wall assembly regulator SMI1
MTETIKEICQRLDALWTVMRPQLALELRPGAASDELAASTGPLLTPELKSLYAWHDGAEDIHRPFEGFFGWSPLADVTSTKRMLDELEVESFQRDGWPPGVWWNSGWIPFLQFNCSDYVCVDVPGSLGRGSGAAFIRRNSGEERVVLAPSLLEWLRAHLEITASGPRGADHDAWVEHFESEKARTIRSIVSPGFPTSVHAEMP